MSFSPESEYPCLLDRIVSAGASGWRERKPITFGEYRAAVFRDLKWLLNSPQFPRPNRLDRPPMETGTPHDCDEHLRAEGNRRGYRYPFVRKSVLNYGVRSLTGMNTQGMNIVELENELKEAIIYFEPRLDPASLSVKLVEDHARPGTLGFEMKGWLRALPHTEAIFLRSEFDLESGNCTIKDLT
ncbi:MAG TPA: type VI secretion system baseplate subunit TssE [Chthoniobacter sp.]|jgi:type VI secretion system protein ImpF